MTTLRMKIMERIAASAYARAAVEDKADLSAFKQKPTRKALLGIAIIAFSYIIGWPAIGTLAIVSARLNQPFLLAAGGPILYVLSHLVFMAGTVLAGVDYAKIFFRWATRVLVEKWMDKKLESV